MGGKSSKAKRQFLLPKQVLSIFLAIVLGVSLGNLSAFAGEAVSEENADGAAGFALEEVTDDSLPPSDGSSHDAQKDALAIVEPEGGSSGEDGTSEPNENDNASAINNADAKALVPESLNEEGAIATITGEEAASVFDDNDDYIGLFITNGKGKITGFSFKSGITPTDIVIPAAIKDEVITSIGASAFAGLGLTSVVIPDTVIAIDTAAFKSNPLTGGVTLSENLKTLGGSAFYGCGLTSIDIPDSVTSIGWGAFHSCKSLRSVTLPNNPDFDLLSSASNIFYGCSLLESIDIPNSVTRIPDATFNGCSYLAQITLPEGLLVIGSGAFSGANAEYVKVPSTVTEIGGGAFSLWKNATIHLPDHLPGTVEGSPWGASGTSIVLWKEIEDSCFYFDVDTQTIIGFKPAGHNNCSHSEWHQAGAEIEIPVSIIVEGVPYDVLALDDYSLYANTDLSGVTFEAGSKITVIPDSAFKSCSNLKQVVLPEGLEKIGNNAFSGCGKLNAITFPSTLKDIGEFAFMSTGLTSVAFPDGLLSIGNRAFNTTGVQVVTIPASVVYIGNWAFHYAKKVTIEGNNIALEVDEVAFNNAESCTDIYVKGYNKDTLACAPWGAQYAVIHWADQDEDPDVLKIEDDNGKVVWHYNRVTQTLISYRGESGASVDLVVPSEVKYKGDFYPVMALDSNLFPGNARTFNTVTIEEGSVTVIPAFFLSNSKINEVILPNGIKTVGSNAFAGSTLSKVNFPEGLSALGISAFQGTKLSELNLPSTLVDIGGSAFKNCSELTTVEFPEGLLSIQGEAFANCNLTGELILYQKVNRIDANSFTGNPNLKKISVMQYRIGNLDPKSPNSVKGNQPWGATAAEIVFLGETPEASHVVTPTSDVTGRGRIIDFSTWIAAGGLNITGIWVQQDDGALIDLFGPLSQKPEQNLQFVALENATYTFYVRTAYQANVDPTDCFSHEVEITDIGKISMDAEDVILSIAKKGQFEADDILVLADAQSFDNDSSNNSTIDATGFMFEISNEDMARVNSELVNIDDEIEITLWGSYKDAYDLGENAYRASGAYSEDTSGNHLRVDNTYSYTNRTSTLIKVKLAGFRVHFDLNGGSAPEEAVGDPYVDQFIGAGGVAIEPADPVRLHHRFQGWALEGDPTDMWEFSRDVTGDITLVAMWEDALYGYTIHYYVDGEKQDWDETGTGMVGSQITLSEVPDKCPDGYIQQKVENIPFAISDSPTENVAHIYYVKVDRSVAIDASDFRMSLAEAQAHQNKTADAQFYEIIARGIASAWWTDTKENVEIIGIKVVPSSGNGKSIDASVGEYYVTYYAGLGEYEVSITVLATVYGEEPIVPTPVIPTPTPGTVTPTPETTTPAEPDQPAIDELVEDIVEPIAAVMEDVVQAVVDPPETVIADDGTPLASVDHPWCWVHYYMILGLILTVAYAGAVVFRRRSFTKSLRDFESEVLGYKEKHYPQGTSTTYPVGHSAT